MPPCASARNARLPPVEAMATPASKPMSPASLGEVPARRVTLVPFASAELISASWTSPPSSAVAAVPMAAPSITVMLGAHRVQVPGVPPPASTCTPRRSKSPPVNVVMLPPAASPRADRPPNAAREVPALMKMVPPVPALALASMVVPSTSTIASVARISTEPPLSRPLALIELKSTPSPSNPTEAAEINTLPPANAPPLTSRVPGSNPSGKPPTSTVPPSAVSSMRPARLAVVFARRLPVVVMDAVPSALLARMRICPPSALVVL